MEYQWHTPMREAPNTSLPPYKNFTWNKRYGIEGQSEDVSEKIMRVAGFKTGDLRIFDYHFKKYGDAYRETHYGEGILFSEVFKDSKP